MPTMSTSVAAVPRQVIGSAGPNPYTVRPASGLAGYPVELGAIEAELAARWPQNRLEPSLGRIHALMDLLGRPQHSFRSVHITGTNGKTSTARMVEQLLDAFGLRTGRFTSPHVESVTERISLGGAPIGVERFIETYRGIEPAIRKVDLAQPDELTFFEVLTGMGYVAFADAGVDAAVVEVGLGGRWDATNVIDADVAVITPVSLDHTDRLGSTTGEIAAQKAGIIKPGALAVVARQPADAAAAILEHAERVGARLVREGVEFDVLHRESTAGGQLVTLRGLGGTVYEDVFLPLYGEYQARNAAGALAAVEGLLGAGAAGLDPEKVRKAFSAVSTPGRLEVVRRSPTVILDAAHNPAGAEVTAAAVSEAFGSDRPVGVIAATGDKDVSGLLAAFEPVLSELVVTRNSTHRAMPVETLVAQAVEFFGTDRIRVEPHLEAAIDTAVALAEQEGRAGVLITGSVITVGEARLILGGSNQA